VEDHAVVLEAEPAGDLRVGGIRRQALARRLHGDQLLVEEVRVFDITGIKSEVDLEGVVGDPGQSGQVERPGLVGGLSE